MSCLKKTIFQKKLEDEYSVPEITKKDAVVVLLGGTVLFNDTIDQYVWEGAVARLMEGIRLFKKGGGKKLVFTGGTPYSHEGLFNEIDSMKKLALELGISEKDLILEPQAQNTYEHAQYLKPIFIKNNIQTFYLVTSALHLPRAMKVFLKQGLRPTSYPVERLSRPFQLNFGLQYISLLVPILHEYLGLTAYRFSGKI